MQITSKGTGILVASFHMVVMFNISDFLDVKNYVSILDRSRIELQFNYTTAA